MKREYGDNVRGNRDGREDTGGRRGDRERLEGCLLRACVLWVEISWKGRAG